MDIKTVKGVTSQYDTYLRDDNIAATAVGKGIYVDITADINEGIMKLNEVEDGDIYASEKDLDHHSLTLGKCRESYYDDQATQKLLTEKHAIWSTARNMRYNSYP